MKYTKGKWIIKDGTSIESTNGYCIADTGYDDEKEDKANAKLISKAPKMYEALKDIQNMKSLIEYPSDIPESQYGEARAVSLLIEKLESLLKEIES